MGVCGSWYMCSRDWVLAGKPGSVSYMWPACPHLDHSRGLDLPATMMGVRLPVGKALVDRIWRLSLRGEGSSWGEDPQGIPRDRPALPQAKV